MYVGQVGSAGKQAGLALRAILLGITKVQIALKLMPFSERTRKLEQYTVGSILLADSFSLGKVFGGIKREIPFHAKLTRKLGYSLTCRDVLPGSFPST